MSMKISENADAKLLKPGAEVTFDRDGELIPIPVPTPPLVLGQKWAYKAQSYLDQYIKGIIHCDDLMELFADDLQQLESAMHLIGKHRSKLSELTGFEDVS